MPAPLCFACPGPLPRGAARAAPARAARPPAPAPRRRPRACLSAAPAPLDPAGVPLGPAGAPHDPLAPPAGAAAAPPLSDRALLLRLAAPTYVAQLADPVAALVDLYFIGALGALPLAGASVASSVFNSVVYLFGLLSFTANAVVASAVATGDRARVARAALSAVVLAAGLGAVAAAPMAAFAPRLVRAMGAAPGEVAANAVGYLRARSAGVPALVVFFALSGVFRGLADLRRPLYASVAGNLVNVVLDPVLIFAPVALGCVGAGLATSAAAYVTVTYLCMHLVRTGVVPWRMWREALRVPWSDVRAVFGPLVALSSKRILENGILALACARAARIGPAEAAAMEIGRQVWWAVGILWWPLCVAVAAIVSKAVAERSGPARIREITFTVVRVVLVLGAIGGAATFALAGVVPHAFIRDAAFLAPATESLRIMAPLLTVSSLMDVCDATLIAGNDGAVNLATTALAVAVAAARLLSGKVATITHIWQALLLSYVIRLGLNLIRFSYLYRPRRR